jgi:hypothetical protein
MQQMFFFGFFFWVSIFVIQLNKLSPRPVLFVDVLWFTTEYTPS